MRLWHVLVPLLGCGCSLDTAPHARRAAVEQAAADGGSSLAAVSFSAWQRILGPARHAAATSPHELAPDAGQPVPTMDAALPAEPRARDAAVPAARRESGAERAPMGAPARKMASLEQDGADAGMPPASRDPVRESAPRAPATTESAPPGRATGGEAADSGDSASGVPSAGEAEAEPLTTRIQLLELLQTTIEDTFGFLWTPESDAIATGARSLVNGPHDAITRSAVAGLLIRLSQTSGCRSDNPWECEKLCNALHDDCSVCLGDAPCQAAVEHVCAPQAGFRCHP